MTAQKKPTAIAALTTLVTLLTAASPALAADTPSFELRLTGGTSYQLRNDVQIPNSDLGTRFSLADAAGEGPIGAVRFEAKWAINDKHGLRLMLAPLSYTEAVTFEDTVLFEGETYQPNQTTDASYKFNSWRIGYFYQFIDTTRTQVDVGATLKVRDAEIRLEQGDTVAFNEDLGLVPLLYFAANHRLSDRWRIGLDVDALGGGPGRAIDLGLTTDYAISDNLLLGLEARILDGGADIDELFNFAQFGSVGLSLSTEF